MNCCCSSSNSKVSPETDINSAFELGAKKLKAEGDEMAREIVVSHFKMLLGENINVTLDQAILSFENAGTELTITWQNMRSQRREQQKCTEQVMKHYLSQRKKRCNKKCHMERY